MGNGYSAALEGTGAHSVADKVLWYKFPCRELSRYVGMTISEMYQDLFKRELISDTDTTEVVEHAPYPPSSAHRWSKCPLSATLNAVDPSDGLVLVDHGIVVFDEEMLRGVSEYVNYCRSLKLRLVHTEKKLEFAGTKGTTDFLGFDQATRTVKVVDLKYGKGYHVEAAGNKQLRYYGAAAAALFTNPEKVTTTIFQPRGFHPDGPVRSVTYDAKKLIAEVKEEIETAIARVKKHPTLAVPGDHCQWCEGVKSGVCAAVKRKALDIFDDFPVEDPSELTNEELDRLLNSAKPINLFIKAAQKIARERMLNGETLDSHKLVASQGNRAWIDHKDFASWAEKKLRIAKTDLFTDPIPLSPAQLEKQYLNKTQKEKIKRFIERPFNGYVVAGKDDKRKEYVPPKKDFDDSEAFDDNHDWSEGF